MLTNGERDETKKEKKDFDEKDSTIGKEEECSVAVKIFKASCPNRYFLNELEIYAYLTLLFHCLNCH